MFGTYATMWAGSLRQNLATWKGCRLKRQKKRDPITGRAKTGLIVSELSDRGRGQILLLLRRLRGEVLLRLTDEVEAAGDADEVFLGHRAIGDRQRRLQR